ncbi:MAG: caspase family protein [Hyphomicrobiaceae bacterium]
MWKLVGALIVLLAGLAEPAWAAPKRVALVVGVGGYRHVAPLPNAVNDARGIGQALQNVGFAVDVVTDGGRTEIERAIRKFGSEAAGAEAALFYYAGHAVEVDGRNWLLPADTQVVAPRDLRFEAIDLEAVLEQTAGRALVNLVFLDACRDNPFRARLATGGRGMSVRAGLGQVQAAVGTLIAFAAAPGAVAADADGDSVNSPFTSALLRHIATPGLEVRRLLTLVRSEVRRATANAQTPWDNSSLEGDFYFVAPDGAETAPRPAPQIALAAPPAVRHMAPLDGKAPPPTPFDGLWEVTQTCAPSRDAKGYRTTFSGRVQDGRFLAARGEAGKPGYLKLEGNVGPDGTSTIAADGISGHSSLTVGRAPPGLAYTFTIAAKFAATSGTGSRIELRPCDFTFRKIK